MRPIAVIGPQNPISDGAIRDQCTIANIPHIQATWQPLDVESDEAEEQEENEGEETAEVEDEANQEETENKEETDEEGLPITDLKFKDISINFYPDSNEINIAFANLLKYYNWENFAALYEDDFGKGI